MQSREARTSLSSLEGAPVLASRPPATEVLMGVLSVAVVLLGGATMTTAQPPRLLGVVCAVLLLSLAIFWGTRQPPGQVKWTLVDSAARGAALIAMTLPAYLLIWPADDHVVAGAWISSTIAATALGAFIVLRWRQ